jgi:hypothetical protein
VSRCIGHCFGDPASIQALRHRGPEPGNGARLVLGVFWERACLSPAYALMNRTEMVSAGAFDCFQKTKMRTPLAHSLLGELSALHCDHRQV